MKKILILCSVALFLAACTQESEFGNKPTYSVDYSGVEVTENTLSVEQAMNNMNFVYRNFESKEHKIRKIRKVEMLTMGNLRPSSLTRSGLGEDAEEQPLAYVVNFEEEAGYAILAADAQLPPIIMLGDEGNFSTQNYLDFLQRTETRSGGTDFDPSNVQDLQYAIVTNSLIVRPPVDLPLIGQPHDTTVLLKCWPLLKTKWGQWAPYNHYAPTVGGDKCPAGCTAIACAQTIASLVYHQNLRVDLDVQGYYADMDIINRMLVAGTTGFSYNDQSANALEVAKLIRAVGAYLQTNYTPNGSKAPIENFQGLLAALGAINPTHYNYFDAEKAFTMIVDRQLPTIVSGFSEVEGQTDLEGHAFVLDGWLRMEYRKNIYSNTSIYPDSKGYQFDLVHINFGWNGGYDGYYLPGAFHVDEDRFEDMEDMVEEGDIPDHYDSSLHSHKYELNLKQLTYNY